MVAVDYCHGGGALLAPPTATSRFVKLPLPCPWYPPLDNLPLHNIEQL